MEVFIHFFLILRYRHKKITVMIDTDKKFVVAIGRQFGSGGHNIAKKLAEKLGISFYDKELLLEAAKETGLNPDLFEKADEKLPSFYISNISMNIGYYIQPFHPSHSANFYERVNKAICDMIEEIAQKESCVIVGRCADHILRNKEKCISIFISADKDSCAERVMQRTEGLSKSEAIALATKEDKLRAEYYNFYTDKEWGTANSYDLCIDSSKLAEDKVIDILINYIETRLKD